MALTFHHCRSCGGKIQIDPAVPSAERRCMLCGKACCGEDAIDAEEENSIPSPVEAESADRGHRRMTAVTCPRCRALTLCAADEPPEKRHCQSCGRPFEKEKKSKGRLRKPAELTPDGVLVRRSQERVWVPIAGAALCFVFVAIFAVWMAWGRPARHSKAAVVSPPAEARDEIRRLAGHWMSATTPEDLLALVRQPETFTGAVQAWCAAHPNALPLGGSVLGVSAPRKVLNTRVAEVPIHFDTIPGMSMIAVETPAGWKVEWRAFSGIGDLSVEEFLRVKPAVPALILAVVLRSDYYNGPYADTAAWLCLRLNDLSGTHPFYAYVPRGKAHLMEAMAGLPPAPAASAGKAELAKSSRLMALRLHFNDAAATANGQAEVTSIAGESWYVP
jgi:hypothetical protein